MAQPAVAAGVIDFENLVLGTTSFNDGDFANISGGTVVASSIDYPAFSGTQLYGGTLVSGIVDDIVAEGYPAIGAYVTGAGTITLRTFGYDMDLATEYPIASFSISGSLANTLLSTGLLGATVSRWEFTSDQYFTVDDMALGWPGVPDAIPEPSSWALMIGGFGAIGLAARRKRVLLTPA